MENVDILGLVLRRLATCRELAVCSTVSRQWRTAVDRERCRLKILFLDGDVHGCSLVLVDVLDNRFKTMLELRLPPPPPPAPAKTPSSTSRLTLDITLCYSFPLCYHQGKLLLFINTNREEEHQPLVIFGDMLFNTWRPIPALSSHHLGFPVDSATFSHDGKLLIVCDRLKNTAILDVESNVWKMGYVPQFEDLRPGQRCNSCLPKVWDRRDPLHELKCDSLVWVDGAFYACMFRTVRGVSWEECYRMHLVEDGWLTLEPVKDVWDYCRSLDDVCIARFNVEEMRWREVEVELPAGMRWRDVRLPSSDARRMLVVIWRTEGLRSCTAWYDPTSGRLVPREWFDSDSESVQNVRVKLALSDEFKFWTAFSYGMNAFRFQAESLDVSLGGRVAFKDEQDSELMRNNEECRGSCSQDSLGVSLAGYGITVFHHPVSCERIILPRTNDMKGSAIANVCLTFGDVSTSFELSVTHARVILPVVGLFNWILTPKP